MCGICGYIGQSKNPRLTYELITELFGVLQIRGTDASGVWGTEIGENGRVIYHKEPIRSEEFIQNSFWKDLKKVRCNLMLVHARATSRGNGNASINANNHPFTSVDRRIGMVHNGTLEEFDFLKKKYDTNSNTDSEVLLRMYEYGIGTPFLEESGEIVANRLTGIKDIWSVISEGAMAVAIGERLRDGGRLLFLFRNSKRPLWVADLRSALGQIFFFSSPEVWYRAVAKSESLRKLSVDTRSLTEIPKQQLWVFCTTPEQPVLLNTSKALRLDIEVEETEEEWVPGTHIPIQPPVDKLELITKLGDHDTLIDNNTELCELPALDTDLFSSSFTNTKRSETFGMSLFEPRSTEHQELCRQITDIVNRIDTVATNACSECMFTTDEYSDLLESLEQTRTDLEGTLKVLGL